MTCLDAGFSAYEFQDALEWKATKLFSKFGERWKLCVDLCGKRRRVGFACFAAADRSCLAGSCIQHLYWRASRQTSSRSLSFPPVLIACDARKYLPLSYREPAGTCGFLGAPTLLDLERYGAIDRKKVLEKIIKDSFDRRVVTQDKAVFDIAS